MSNPGRKGKYSDWITEEGLLLIRGWARDGFSDKQIASEKMGIGETTLCAWKNKFPEILDALKKGRTPVCYKVEEAFYSKCEWKKVVEVTRTYVQDSEGNLTSDIQVTEHEKWIPPDTTALIFVSKNIMPHKFRDKPMPPIEEKTESDGLIEALNGTAERVFGDGDDSERLKE